MAYDIAMNVNTGDLVIQNGDLVLIDHAERVAQQILITLREWLGEWFLDTRDGVPYLEYILVKNPNENHIRQILMEKISSVEGVSSVKSMTLAMNNFSRTLAVEYEAETIYGLVKRKELLGYGRN
ncbi:hypothetical protein [Megasphaera stantonii]|uniref:Uncharacterized protein n=1 Tax=Megasphaera stantonii TaxID=2144175 RepID=A0A346B180_9FIRM|nr:hypothetical protein [Megasphaera stantonii]AXL21873.1 hypothetical protein DKB62_10025 [Megasphaera stantonii]